ncbi:MAG: flagellar hook-associated protein FlgK [Sphingomonas oligoaromativorans]|jgi:flagellar hook-associated protein 1 FlgK|uniref:flagellar hook-associated protein FlgK n=1 Tax=Sphingomonas oligoaromativorans TaxID=575322 RepID=UPI00142004B3|nr:flagellar hook-associated protein FlgK [Sphingomonas oligoaromativorans]NIJ31963.1 flagellar hook-associated protein 1 FlgK [Sphingomonas oligoaromativorans]
MSDLLGIGASGVAAYSNMLSAIGNNVTNASTPGYTRRSVTFAQNTSANATSLYFTSRPEFSGVSTVAVTRSWNDYQAAVARTAAGEAGRADARATWLGNAESALNDTATGVGQSATAFFSAGNALAADAGNTGNRQAFLNALNQTASAFNTTANALAQTSAGIATAAQTSVQTVNSDLDALDKVNASLNHQVAGSSAQADLMDQRDRILDDLSSQIGINVKLDDSGVATVTLANASSIQLTASIGNSSSQLPGTRFMLEQGDNGALQLSAVTAGKPQAIAAPGGELGGLVESAQTVTDRRNSLNKMATDFVKSVNDWQAAGLNPAGTAGVPLLSGTDAASITLTTNDPSAIAAASSTASNGNLLNLSSLRGDSGLEKTWAGMITDQGQMVSAAQSENTATAAASNSAFAARDSLTGVDLNTEAGEMIRYQQAYSGAAKVIQVAKDTMQSIFDLF